MVDLVERLRGYRPANEWGDSVEHTICNEAADEIERLCAAMKQVEDYHRAKSLEIWEASRDGLSDDQKKEYGIAWCVHAASAYAIKTLITPEASRVGADVTNHGSKSLLDPEYVTPAGDA